jgi:Methyltransferase FkbM domain
MKHHAIPVDCISIMDIVDEFGVPDYMKIDIEGNDRICIAGLTKAAAPPYISIEMDHTPGDEDIQRLADLGYRGFKVICQNCSWHQATARNVWFYELGRKHSIALLVRRLRSAAAKQNVRKKIWGVRSLGREDIRVLALVRSCLRCLAFATRTR